jgi:peptide/nickel transport system substrate-binding protein
MNTRSGLVTFLLFLLLGVMIVLQIMGMIQSDRLYERLNVLLDRLAGGETVRTNTAAEAAKATDLPMPPYPGDEGDWLVWRLEDDPATLNPITETSMYGRYVTSGTIFESLLDYDPDELKLRPFLAQNYKVSEDGLEIYFRLRDNIHFSDGHPITADDILFTFRTITDPNVDALSYANYFKDVERYEKLSDLEIKFFMKQVYFKSLEFLGGMPIIPEHVYRYKNGDEFNKRRSNPVGSGPYVLKDWTIGQQVVLERNENYWAHRPKLRKIVYRVITNDTAALQALRTGDIDYMRPLPDQYAEFRDDKEFAKDIYCLSYWTPAAGYFWIGWNQDRPFFEDRRVRLAMTYLVDRETILRKLLKSPDAIIPTGPFYVFGKQADPNIKPWPYDPEKSKHLLDEAGWVDTDGDGVRDKDGVPFRFHYTTVSGLSLHTQLSILVKSECAKVGIDVIPDPYEGTVFFQRIHDRQFDAVNMAWGGGLAQDPYQIWHSSQIGNRGSNYVGFNNAEADRLMEEARKTLDEEKRDELYHRFHRIIHQEQPYTFIYTRPEQRFLSRRFENVKVHKLGLNELEWYVPKAKQKYK